METGTQIGPYRIEGLLGRGGMAEVYKAWHVNLHRHEALKALPMAMTFDRSFVERFLHEARMAARLQHPHIAAIHAVSEAEAAQPYFTMELVEGGDLSDLLTQRGRLSLAEALPILRQIAQALDHAHANGIVHRDVKPGNVLLKDDGHGGWTIKVVDFGIAHAQEEAGGTRLTKTGVIVGTPEYMSPEQAGSGQPVDYHTDQYSLAVVAYEMLCGQPPFHAEANTSAMSVLIRHIRDAPRPPVQYVPGLPAAVNNAILKALAKEPAQRFDSCAGFIEALAHTPIRIETDRRPPARSRLVLALAGVALLAGAGLIGMSMRQGGPSSGPGETGVVSPERTPAQVVMPATTSTPGTTPARSATPTPTISRSDDSAAAAAAIQAYFQAWSRHDVEAAYSLYSHALQRMIPINKYREYFGHSTPQLLECHTLSVSGDKAVVYGKWVTYKNSASSGTTLAGPIQLCKEEGEWKIRTMKDCHPQ